MSNARSSRRARDGDAHLPKVSVPATERPAPCDAGPWCKNRQRAARVYEGGQYDLTLSSFLTSFTPLTDRATEVAADFAPALSTKPDNCTTPALVSTLIW